MAVPDPAPLLRRDVRVERLGHDREPLLIVDGFAPDPDALRAAAAAAVFEPAGEHYPGVRAPLPNGYLRSAMPGLARLFGRAFGRLRRVHVVDASFAMVTASPDVLLPRQRIPHVDAYARERIAMVHYLARDSEDGTAFFRHRSTGHERIDAERAPGFFARLDADLTAHPPPCGYVTGDTPLFERIATVKAAYNRAIFYRSYLLHSGAISPDAALSADPTRGRLTITGFFAVE